jgi:UTP--glucose-1-phosphate uridylyltransferase
LADYPHFNTNTLWLHTAAIDREIDLSWFAVRKTIEWFGSRGGSAPTAGELDVVQFERLIGQVTEFVPSAFLEVERSQRFLPIKTREDLAEARPQLERFARAAGLLG